MSTSASVSGQTASGGHGPGPRRLLLYVHYNQWGTIADYVVYFFKHVREIYTKIIFISSSPLSEDVRLPLQGFYDLFYPRANNGCAFHAWKETLACLGSERLATYDSVTLMTDKCFGPLFGLKKAYRKMKARDVDFWGITRAPQAAGAASPAEKNAPGSGPIDSSFLCFQQRAVRSGAFRAFWEQVGTENETVSQGVYETQLAETLHQAGLKSAVLCDMSGLEHKVIAKSVLEPELVLEQRLPLLKLSAFFCGTPPENAYLLTLVREQSRYPVALIQDYLSRYLQPDVSLKVTGHCLEERKGTRSAQGATQRIALHIHAFYTDILCGILRKIVRHIKSHIDIFLTTDSKTKAEEIRLLMQRDFPHLRVRALLVCENRGRDIWPWLLVAPMMAGYDFAGHIHTKKSPTASVRFSIQWREELLDCLLGRFPLIKRAFGCNKHLGIVIPDVPTVFRFPPYHYNYGTDTIGKRLLTEAWDLLGHSRPVDFSAMKVLIFPYGNMFWYRPNALEPLWMAPWPIAKIPKEPVPIHGTLLHAMERLPVYVSWSQGYDFQIVPSTALRATGFQSELALVAFPRNIPAPKNSKEHKQNMLKILHNKIRQHHMSTNNG